MNIIITESKDRAFTRGLIALRQLHKGVSEEGRLKSRNSSISPAIFVHTNPCMLTDDLLFLGINTWVPSANFPYFSLLTCRSPFPSTSFFSFDRYMYPCLSLWSFTQFSRNLFYLRLENVHCEKKNRSIIWESRMCLHPR